MANPKASSEVTEVTNTVDLDGISLSQALLDFEVANARVIDLTKRLTAMNKELVKTTTALQKAELRNRHLASELKAIKQSRAFRSAEIATRIARGARARLGG
jgi:predicted  nucleic acid-binding Zn-ribbon protein